MGAAEKIGRRMFEASDAQRLAVDYRDDAVAAAQWWSSASEEDRAQVGMLVYAEVAIAKIMSEKIGADYSSFIAVYRITLAHPTILERIVGDVPGLDELMRDIKAILDNEKRTININWSHPADTADAKIEEAP